MTTLAGHTLDNRYQVDELIGRGGMADVYRGIDKMLDRAVAIKVLTERDDGEQDRFLREARSMARLNHRNIVAVYDAGRSDGWSYIVMELVEGRTLGAVPAHELTIHTAIRHYIDILEGLEYAHERGVIHRDLKPANVMVVPSGAVKVMDFGLARRMSEMSSVTTAGEIVGTIAYLPPERFLGKLADERSDLYSVGVMLYETFAGAQPFRSESDDLVAVIFGHVNEPPPSPRSHNRAVPPQIERIILKLLEKEPDRRYQTAREVLAELRTLLGTGQPSADPKLQTNAPPPAGKPSRAASTAEADAREILARTFGRSKTIDIGYSETLAGMLATRKRDYTEAARAYRAALDAFAEANNELEAAKTALKYGTMILQKNSEGSVLDRRELSGSVDILTEALPAFRGRSMFKELEEGERLLYALQRTLIRTR
ncbi:MAG: putative Mitogen-activated protein kinase kinase kinase [Candidatus Eremiobacteraeota bacterium]|nr:putative Mitogen-activated protein kinase kinase kinase [Candidatus Eremiobacteraeota bacterium]